MTLLSIVIPTYNRADLVTCLLERLLAEPGDFEICVQDDGSLDDTKARVTALANLHHGRLRFGSDPNRGRAAALNAAVAMARGRFAMLFDDDDTLLPEGLAVILSDCASDIPEGCAGFIYHLAYANGLRLGSAFPEGHHNLLALRADHGVKGDKKEVIRTEVLRRAMQPPETARRVPTSLYWARIALAQDVICRNVIVGTKTYKPGGMTASIKRLKRENALPLFRINQIKLKAFLNGRYRSTSYATRALAGLIWHGLHAVRMRLGRQV